MTTNDTNREPPQALPTRSWVWRCTKTSIETGQISLFAMVETLAAVAVYWYLLWSFNWPWMMFISMFAAPLLLLRSEQSVTLGLQWLGVYFDRDEKSITLLEKGSIIGGTAIITGLVCYWLVQHWLSGHTGWPLLWRATGLGAVVVVFAFAAAFAVAVAFVVSGAFVVAGAVASAVASAVVVAVAVVVVVVGAGAGAGAGASALAGALSGALAVAGALGVAGAESIMLVLFGPFVVIGVLVRTLLIRLFATLRHPIAGLKQLPQNWRSTLWAIDPCHLPELLPQAGVVNENFTLAGLWAGYQNANMASKVKAIVFTPFFYLPAMLYRWSLKASAWLWFPLVLVLTPPLYQQTPKATRKMLAIIPAWHWLYVAGASLVLVWMFLPWPFIVHWVHKFSPGLVDLASSLPTAPQFGLRMVIACTFALLTLFLVYRTKNFYASYAKVLESPNEFRQLDPDDKKEFMDDAKGIDRIRTSMIAAIILWGYASVLGLARHLYPAETVRLVWAWLLAIL